jgi:hypothetical protein
VTSANLPDVARTLRKGVIMSLAGSGLISRADAEHLIALLELGDA